MNACRPVRIGVSHGDIPTEYSKIITTDPARRSGKPCIRDLRVTVDDVLDYLGAGMTKEEILADFPDRTETDIEACPAIARDPEQRPSS
jgi:uncharacterized protein (DUF433 family)